MKALTDAAISTPSPGDLVRDARRRAGLSREQLAVAAGISMSTVIRLERDGKVPNAAALVRIASRVGLPAADLLPQSAAASAP
jgi:transcriptional regulator with XRE-family HTH domain